METIYKYQLEIIDEQDVELPLGAKILTVQIQYGKPCIWAKVNPDNPKEKYRFITFGTGHQISTNFNGEYIGTYQIMNGNLVFHLYLQNG